MEIFAKAVKTGLTFATPRGSRLPQEIYQLPLTGNNGFNLDEVSKMLLKKINAQGEESLVVSSSKVSPKDKLRLEILKFIINDKQQEAAAKEQDVIRKKRIEQIQSLIATKQQEEQASKSLEELQAELLSLVK